MTSHAVKLWINYAFTILVAVHNQQALRRISKRNVSLFWDILAHQERRVGANNLRHSQVGREHQRSDLLCCHQDVVLRSAAEGDRMSMNLWAHGLAEDVAARSRRFLRSEIWSESRRVACERISGQTEF